MQVDHLELKREFCDYVLVYKPQTLFDSTSNQHFTQDIWLASRKKLCFLYKFQPKESIKEYNYLFIANEQIEGADNYFYIKAITSIGQDSQQNVCYPCVQFLKGLQMSNTIEPKERKQLINK